MSVIRATSDLHLSARTAPWVFAALAEMAVDAREHKGWTVLVGDIFDQALMVHMPTWNRLRRTLYSWPGRMIVVAGNHDQYDLPRNCLEGLAGGSCQVIDRPAWLSIGRVVPYTKPEDFTAALNDCGPQPAGGPCLDFIWTHHGFKGAYRNTMNRDSDGVSCAAIPPRHLVITGHYHMPQNLGRIIYCGSPYETTFAEEGQKKGWLRWEDPFDEPIPVRVPFGDIGAPRHFTVRWDPAQGPPKPPPGLRPTDRVRVITEATREVAVAQAKQLAKAGLEGAALLAKPAAGSSRGIVKPGDAPQHAASRYVVANAGKWDPREMDEFAEESGLWAN